MSNTSNAPAQASGSALAPASNPTNTGVPVQASAPTLKPGPAGTTIKALKLSNTNLDKIELLDMGKHNWPTWSDSMMNLLLLNACGGYILGTIPRPADADSAAVWDTNNLCIIAAIRTCCTREESQLLRNATNAKDAWNALRTRYEKLGPVAQILLIQEALAVQFRQSDRLDTTATRLWDIVDRIYAIGIPQQDDFLLIFLMNALSAEFPALRNHIADCINASSAADPYTFAHAFRRLDMEQQLLDNEKHRQGGALALAASANPCKCSNCSQVGHGVCCANCNGTGHTREQCWRPGGGRAGERDTILAEKRAAKSKPKNAVNTTPSPMPPGKPTTASTLRYDTSGRAYILDASTREAVFVAATP